MNSSEAETYNNELVRDVFGSLSIDKTRLPSSGLTSIGVPSFVASAQWALTRNIQVITRKLKRGY